MFTYSYDEAIKLGGMVQNALKFLTVSLKFNL